MVVVVSFKQEKIDAMIRKKRRKNCFAWLGTVFKVIISSI